ncbi:MAG: orotidine-5'-phosphate decarboxylase [Microbacteriaceae bacterium]
MRSDPFGARLAAAFAAHGPLCVGIDPHDWLLEAWRLPSSAQGAREFGLAAVAAAHGRVGIVKPQVAFYERFGSAGFAALEAVLSAARAAGLLVIADAKRGDIGSTADAYAQAWLSPGSPLEADALTVAAFQGVGSLAGMMSLAEANGKGLFVLAATTNPEAAPIQTALVQSSAPRHHDQSLGGAARTVSRAIIDDVIAFNAGQAGHPIGSIGVVLGATLDLAAFGVQTDAKAAHNPMPVLAPGFGAQGALVSQARRRFGALAATTIISESRSILTAGPDALAETITRRAAEVREHLG